MSEDDVRALVGHRFPGRRLRLDPAVEGTLREVIGAPPAVGDEPAHPLMVFLLGQGGLGVTLDELFELCGATAADGPVLGEWTTEIRTPLRRGVDYRVTAEIDGVVRKRGARTGVFDVVSTRVEISGERGGVHAVARTAIVYPRRGAR